MTYCVRFAMPKRKRTTQRARDSENARRRGKVKVKTISDFTWHKLSVKEKFDREPIGSVYLLKSTARAQQYNLKCVQAKDSAWSGVLRIITTVAP